jgi:hypothetical protein
LIYFLKAEQDNGLRLRAGWIKIGTTTRLSMRLQQIAAEIGHMPTVLAVLDGSYAEEYALHEKFEGIRAKGEWFLPEDVLLRLIETEGRPWDGDVPTKLVKIKTEIATKARYVAAKQGVPLIDLLSDILDPVIDREFRKAGKDITEGSK